MFSLDRIREWMKFQILKIRGRKFFNRTRKIYNRSNEISISHNKRKHFHNIQGGN